MLGKIVIASNKVPYMELFVDEYLVVIRPSHDQAPSRQNRDYRSQGCPGSLMERHRSQCGLWSLSEQPRSKEPDMESSEPDCVRRCRQLLRAGISTSSLRNGTGTGDVVRSQLLVRWRTW